MIFFSPMGRTLVDFDFAFPHSYEVEEVGEFPGTGVFQAPIIHFPRPTKNRSDDNGLWLRVKARRGKTWMGVFARGYNAPPAFSRVLSTPVPDQLCVVADGSAYSVDSKNPGAWEQIPINPVLEVQPVLEQNLLIFGDFTRLVAHGTNGLLWKTQRLCWDELKITKLEGNTVEGTGYDPTNRAAPTMRFVVDLKTGRLLLPSPFQNCE